MKISCLAEEIKPSDGPSPPGIKSQSLLHCLRFYGAIVRKNLVKRMLRTLMGGKETWFLVPVKGLLRKKNLRTESPGFFSPNNGLETVLVHLIC